MEGLEAEYTKVQVNYDNAARRFGEDPTKVPSGEFFALMSVRLVFYNVALLCIFLYPSLKTHGLYT